MRERTAYHEAGHAVAAFSQRKRLHKVSIKADHDAGVLGYVKHTVGIGEGITYAYDDSYLRRVTEEATLLFAGVLAEREHTQGRHNWAGAASDRRNAVDLACRIMSDDEVGPYFKWVMLRTRNLVKWRWRAIEALAQELLVRDEMSGAAATEVIQHAIWPPQAGDEELRAALQKMTKAKARTPK